MPIAALSQTQFSKNQKVKYRHYIEVHENSLQHPYKHLTKDAAIAKRTEYTVIIAQLIPQNYHKELKVFHSNLETQSMVINVINRKHTNQPYIGSSFILPDCVQKGGIML